MSVYILNCLWVEKKSPTLLGPCTLRLLLPRPLAGQPWALWNMVAAISHKASFSGPDSQYVDCHFLCEAPFEGVRETGQTLFSKAPRHRCTFSCHDEEPPGDEGPSRQEKYVFSVRRRRFSKTFYSGPLNSLALPHTCLEAVTLAIDHQEGEAQEQSLASSLLRLVGVACATSPFCPLHS